MAVTIANIVSGGASVAIGSDIGAIKDGITITPTTELLTVDIEQFLTSPKAWVMSKGWTVEFTYVEPTEANIKIAWDVASSITAGPPATLKFGVPTTGASSEFTPQERVLSLTSIVPGGTTVRTLLFYKTVLETPAPLVFSKRQEVNMKVGFRALYDHVTTQSVGQFSDA